LAAFILEFEDAIAFFLPLEGFKILPKGLVLLHHLLIGNREFEAKEKVSEGVPG